MKIAKPILPLLILMALLWSPILADGQNNTDKDTVKLENPITVDYLKRHLKKSGPKLALTPALERNLKRKIKRDPLVENYYLALKADADRVVNEPTLTRNVIGRRLLRTSRDLLHRVNVLGIAYKIENDTKYLDKINEEIKAVSNFSDWNPSHFLDVAEMATAVALAVDWVGDDLPNATVKMAKDALIKKGITPSWEGQNRRMYGTNNWNQVCNAGMIAAAIVIADQDIELAAKTISRSLDGIPNGLMQYGPDGAYPEGSTYWGYGTAFTVLTSAMLKTAFGTDFGIGDYPAFKESADFRKLSVAPSGNYYNYADCGDRHSDSGDIILAWFATQSGNALYIEDDKFSQPVADFGKLHRIAGAGLVWLAQFEKTEEAELPLVYKGDGKNPIVIMRDGEGYYFGGKGGKGTVSHGNLDAGSFIWELNGVRWSIDPGNQGYNTLEQAGFDLWGSCQECERWTLLTKNNYGHSTLTVNDELHVNDGFAKMLNVKKGDQPEASFDLTPVFGNNLKQATRKFIKPDNGSIVIEDHIETNVHTKTITWQMMTQADVSIVDGGAVLTQDGEKVKLENLSHPEIMVSVISLDPAPLELDRQIEGLKRLEIRIPVYLIENNSDVIKVKLQAL